MRNHNKPGTNHVKKMFVFFPKTSKKCSPIFLSIDCHSNQFFFFEKLKIFSHDQCPGKNRQHEEASFILKQLLYRRARAPIEPKQLRAWLSPPSKHVCDQYATHKRQRAIVQGTPHCDESPNFFHFFPIITRTGFILMEVEVCIHLLCIFSLLL